MIHLESDGRTKHVYFPLHVKSQALHRQIAQLTGVNDFYLLAKCKPLNPQFSLLDMGIIEGDKIQVVQRLRGGATAHRNPSNPIREANGGIVAFQNFASQNPSCLPTLLQHSLMLRIYPFEYIHKSFDQCTQDQR